MMGLILLALATSAIAASATLRVLADQRSPYPVPNYITGKFAEHLGSNIYNGMSAQIVRNPTFADFAFGAGGETPDGRVRLLSDEERIIAQIRQNASRLRWPQGDIDRLVESRADGLAHFWFRVGARNAVRVSPDTSRFGHRAQRIETSNAKEGIAQWVYLPLHRTRKYEFQLIARSADLQSLTLSLTGNGSNDPAVTTTAGGLSSAWTTLRGAVELPANTPPDALYRLSLTTPAAGQFVIDRLLLYPADHINTFDPDVVRLLKESHLPILRWPGGNFVSGYHFEDGIGLPESRPTRPNPAWSALEPNLFGTDEFIAFCRAVGAEPMICVNAGDGSPDEAARWIEYCNGPITSPMGVKRAANGHPEPYNVRHWEVGNELWGKWQVHWTTPRGNVDRYRQFVPAMLKADATIKLYACGAPVHWGREWNEALFKGAADMLRCTTDHPLIGGNVSSGVDPLDVYRDFMAVPDILGRMWSDMRRSMLDAGVKEPRLAITELQLFAHIRVDGNVPTRLTGANLVAPATHAEALYDTLMYHTAIGLAPFVEMVTHSATVNHGGGLRKDRERVYANPCYYAQSAFAAFAGATPVAMELASPAEKPPRVLGDIKPPTADFTCTTIASLAALAKDGSLLISLVHRGTKDPIDLTIDLAGFKAAGKAEVWQLTADVPWAVNTLEAPEAVKPSTSFAEVKDNRLTVTLRPYTVMQLRLPPVR
jgi:alpha-N-arabinofuranosidase